jgi:hypothetical protein
MQAALRAAVRNGAPLSPQLRAHFERRLGHDFGGVRVHADAESAQAARAIHAKAYTIGQDIVFASGRYAPETAEGKKLLAHELVHVARHSDAEPEVIRRSPDDATGTQALHDELVEAYRAAKGLPAHGIDPSTGMQVGPTDAEIRFGGLLDEWLRGQAGVPAPAKKPTLGGPGNVDTRKFCADLHKSDDNKDRDKYFACWRHREFVENVLPQAAANIRNVASPYSDSIAKLYESVVPMAKYTWEPTPGGPSQTADAHGQVAFGGLTHNLKDVQIGFHQRFPDAEGEAKRIGGGFRIDFNETEANALLHNLPAVESTMVHEAMHVLMWINEDANAARAPGTSATNANLEHASYAALQTKLESAVLPFVTRIQQLPSFPDVPSLPLALRNSALIADKLVSETFAFTEGGIYSNQRKGLQFSAADLRTLPPFLSSFAYWQPMSKVSVAELEAFLQANGAQIEANVKPIILEIGETYLSLRP